MPKIENVIQERNAHYGPSWFTANEVIYAACQGKTENLQKLLDSGHLANWVIIASKFCRAVTSPEDVDHWTDLAGYAELSKALCENRGEEFGIDPDFNPFLPEIEEEPFHIQDTILAQVDRPGNWQQLELPLSKALNEVGEKF